MPQPPDLKCGICDGTGMISERMAADFPKFLKVGERCLCTVTMEEVEAVLPEVIQGILDRNEK